MKGICLNSILRKNISSDPNPPKVEIRNISTTLQLSFLIVSKPVNKTDDVTIENIRVVEQIQKILSTLHVDMVFNSKNTFHTRADLLWENSFDKRLNLLHPMKI